MEVIAAMLGAAIVCGFGFEIGRAFCRWALGIKPALLVEVNHNSEAPVTINAARVSRRGAA